MSLLALISGHGFGHWTRSEAVLQRVAERVPVHVITDGRPLPLAERAEWAASVSCLELGPGAVQRGPLRVDVGGTLEAWRGHLARWDALLEEAKALAREREVRLVYADAPPLAFEFAQALGAPSLAVANFSWSWILEAFVEREPSFAPLVQRLAAAEGLATHSVRLPGGGGLERFGPACAEVLLTRPPTCDEAQARAFLRSVARDQGVEPGERPIVIMSFGGFGDALDLSGAARAVPDHVFVSFAEARGERPENVVVLPHLHRLPFQDLVFGADAVLAKPGYGIVSECLSRPTPLIWCEPNPDFREHPILARLIEAWLPQARLTQAQLLAGEWGPAIRQAIAAPAPPRMPLGGVDVLVERVLDLL